MELNVTYVDPSGNDAYFHDNMFTPFNNNDYVECCTDIHLLESNDISGNYNLENGINIQIEKEYEKYSLLLNDNQNLYREVDNTFRRLKDNILDQFKDTDIFIENLELEEKQVDPLDYRSLLNQNLIKDINQNELYKEMGINYEEFSKNIDNIKTGMCTNFENLQEFQKNIHKQINTLDRDSTKLLGLIDLFDGIDDNDYRQKFKECILEGTEKIYMNTDLKNNIYCTITGYFCYYSHGI